jgi:hypothetical protein
MNVQEELSYGEAQEVKIELQRETYPGKLNVSFTRGFVSSQAFVDRFGDLSGLIPVSADEGLDFVPSHADAENALKWMGFEAYDSILKLLDEAIEDIALFIILDGLRYALFYETSLTRPSPTNCRRTR